MLEIATRRDFAFEATVVSHGWYLLAPFRWNRRGKVLERTEEIGDRAYELRIRFERGRLIVECESDLAPVGVVLGTRLTRMFQLHVDTTEFLALCRATPSHVAVARAKFGRLLCGSTLFEDAVKVITTTNTTWRQTMRMVQLLADRYGARSRSGVAAFPTPQAIARDDPQSLRDQCRLGYRSATIHALAKGIAQGSIDLDRISSPAQSTPELFKSYRSLPGIGPYGAAHLLAMDGRYDSIAVDTEFRRFVRDRYHRGRSVSDRTLLRRYARWGKWQYLAYWSELWISVSKALEQFENRAE